jgi:tetratricopeptide (TPR) repeat protein
MAYRRFYYHLLGEIALAGEDYPQAIKMFDSTLRFATRVDSPFFRTYLGRACLASGDYARAAAEFRRVLEINPNSPETLLYLGKTYVALGDIEKAKAALVRLEAIWKGADADYAPKRELDEMLVTLNRR